MNEKSNHIGGRVLLLLIVLGVIVAFPGFQVIRGFQDIARAKKIGHQIESADNILVTDPLKPLKLAISGDDANKIVKAVAAAKPNRPPPGMESSSTYLMRVTFCRGTNSLAHILICGNSFRLDGILYEDGSGILESRVEAPYYAAVKEARYKELVEHSK